MFTDVHFDFTQCVASEIIDTDDESSEVRLDSQAEDEEEEDEDELRCSDDEGDRIVDNGRCHSDDDEDDDEEGDEFNHSSDDYDGEDFNDDDEDSGRVSFLIDTTSVL